MDNRQIQDFEVLCLLCGRAVDEETAHIVTSGPFGADFDVLCPECFERTCAAQKAEPDLQV